jgi:hypothetical protein
MLMEENKALVEIKDSKEREDKEAIQIEGIKVRKV